MVRDQVARAARTGKKKELLPRNRQKEGEGGRDKRSLPPTMARPMLKKGRKKKKKKKEKNGATQRACPFHVVIRKKGEVPGRNGIETTAMPWR